MSNDAKYLSTVTGGSDLRRRPPPVRTKDEAKRFVYSSLEVLRSKRAECDILIPGNPEQTAKFQQRAFRKLLVHFGVVRGEVTGFYSSGLIDDATYDFIHDESINCLAGKLVGFVDGHILEKKK